MEESKIKAIEKLLENFSASELEDLINSREESKPKAKYYYKCPVCGLMQESIIITDTYRIFPQNAIYGYVRDQSYEGKYTAHFNCKHDIDAESDEFNVRTEEGWRNEASKIILR